MSWATYFRDGTLWIQECSVSFHRAFDTPRLAVESARRQLQGAIDELAAKLNACDGWLIAHPDLPEVGSKWRHQNLQVPDEVISVFCWDAWPGRYFVIYNPAITTQPAIVDLEQFREYWRPA